jgi:hypothetical protein
MKNKKNYVKNIILHWKKMKKMKYKPLIKSCRKAIAEGRCTGCQALENPNFTGNPNCIYGKPPSAEESINKIKEILGTQEKMQI